MDTMYSNDSVELPQFSAKISLDVGGSDSDGSVEQQDDINLTGSDAAQVAPVPCS